MSTVVVVTGIFNDYDELRDPPFVHPDVDYVCFTDGHCTSDVWDVRSVPRAGDARWQSRQYKIVPHRYFPDHAYSLWIDGSHTVAVDPHRLLHYLEDADIALFAHPHRRCIYDEAEVCIDKQKDNSDEIRAQMRRYRKEQYPAQNGLTANGVIVRRHTGQIEELNETWWEHVCTHSVRDQLSFPYCAHLHGVRYATIPGNIYDSPLFPFHRHRICSPSLL